MRRKNKQTRKYKPRNEFRFNNSPTAMGHKNFVFGETSTKFKSLGLTTHPTPKVRHVKLTKNPDRNTPSSDNPKVKDSYLQLKVLTTSKKYMSKPLKNWQFAKEDMPIVRHTIKKYKKSTNRKPQKNGNKKR